MGCNPGGVGVMSRFKDDAWSCLSPMRSDFDGIVCGHSPCTMGGRRHDSNGQCGEQGEVTVQDGETSVDMCTDNLSNTVLGKTDL